MNYWLMKSEPSAFSLRDLRESPGGVSSWDGIRNYQARNYMRDEMRVGDRVLFYHSSVIPPAVVGTATVVRDAYPDHTAWDPDSKYYDPKSAPGKTTWCMVDIRFDVEFERPITLQELRDVPELVGMVLLRKGMRLSIQPVTPEEFQTVLALGTG